MEVVTVIIPIHNADAYLRQCLDSVIGQTYQNLEIILVDDGSTDLSGKICDEYEKMDYRVKVLHKEKGGVTSARNAGLLQATGKYIVFVDSDDWIDQKRIEIMVGALVKEKVDLVYSPYRLEQENGEFRDIIPDFKAGLYVGNEYDKLIEKLVDTNRFYHENLELSLCFTLFRKETFQDIQLSVPKDVRIGEDVICAYGVFTKVKSIFLLNADDGVYYHYRRHGDSSSQIVYVKDCKGIKKLYEICNTFFNNHKFEKILEKQVRMLAYMSLFARAYYIIMKNEKFLFPFPQLVPGKKIAVYGAGLVGVSIVKYCVEKNFTPIVLWVDKAFENYNDYHEKYGVKVDSPHDIKFKKFDYLLISVTDYKVANEIEEIVLKQGVPSEKIIRFGDTELMTKEKLKIIFKYIE